VASTGDYILVDWPLPSTDVSGNQQNAVIGVVIIITMKRFAK